MFGGHFRNSNRLHPDAQKLVQSLHNSDWNEFERLVVNYRGEDSIWKPSLAQLILTSVENSAQAQIAIEISVDVIRDPSKFLNQLVQRIISRAPYLNETIIFSPFRGSPEDFNMMLVIFQQVLRNYSFKITPSQSIFGGFLFTLSSKGQISMIGDLFEHGFPVPPPRTTNQIVNMQRLSLESLDGTELMKYLYPGPQYDDLENYLMRQVYNYDLEYLESNADNILEKVQWFTERVPFEDRLPQTLASLRSKHTSGRFLENLLEPIANPPQIPRHRFPYGRQRTSARPTRR